MAADQMTAGNGPEGHPAMDYEAHRATYKLFTAMIKWGTVLVVFILLMLAFFTL